MLNVGQTLNAVSRAFGCTRRTIQKLADRFRQSGNVRDRPRSGDPRVTTARRDHLRQHFIPATVTGRQNRIFAQTVRNIG